MFKEFLKAILVGLFLAFNFSIIATISEENYFETFALLMLGVFGIGVPFHLYSYAKGNKSKESYGYAGALFAGGYFIIYSVYRFVAGEFIHYELLSVIIFTLVGSLFSAPLGFMCAVTFWSFLVSKKQKDIWVVLFLWGLFVGPYLMFKFLM